MHQVDRGVGLEQVAPGALAGMRLAGNQQHPQPVADALGDHDGAVVADGQFTRQFGCRQLDDVVAAVGNFEFHLALGPGRGGNGAEHLSINGHGYQHRRTCLAAGILRR